MGPRLEFTGARWCAVAGLTAAAIAAVVTAPSAAATNTAPGSSAPVLAGVGRADITPPTGYYMMGWVRSDALVTGQHTRLYARAIVLQSGGRKVALVAEDLNGIPGGMLAAAADLDHDIGFSQENVLDSASHTHAAPSSFYNFSTYNTVAPTKDTPTASNLQGSIDPQLYAFEVRQLALAIRRANSDIAPASVGWGSTQILGLTQNRSLEAHLANYGINEPYGKGSVAQDPGGYADTIDPDVNVLRVDHLAGGRMVPIGMWATFANHGTVNKYTFHYYNADHHGAATRNVEAALRQLGQVPANQDVVNVYGNTDEGDVSSGLIRSGPAAAEYVGGVETAAFLDAWHQAGRHMSATPVLDERWTRTCFCGQQTAAGPVDTRAVFGLSEFTGSEEGRGPLYDLTQVPFEGSHLPVSTGPQGDKIPVTEWGESVPRAVPLMALRLDDRLIVSIPGEMTVAMGRRVRDAVLGATAGSGVQRVVLSGLANEYLDYFTTPEEFQAQHYEGGATVYGVASSLLLQQGLVDLAQRLVTGRPSRPPYPYDASNSVTANAAPFPLGAATATIESQPGAVHRLERAAVSWNGGPRGEDRPLDRAFVSVQRLGADGRWSTVDSDLGLDILWEVDDHGVYHARWEVPLDATLGSYRFEVDGNQYRLQSAPFTVQPSSALSARLLDGAPASSALELTYPAPVVNADLTARPDHAAGGAAKLLVNGQPSTVGASADGRFRLRLHSGDRVDLQPGAAQDRFGNRNANELSWTAGGSGTSAGAGTAAGPTTPAATTLPNTSGPPAAPRASGLAAVLLLSGGVLLSRRRRRSRKGAAD
jgi:hypothetical protein